MAVVAGLFTLTGCATGLPGPGVFGDGSHAERVERGIPDGWEGPNPDLLDGVPVVGWVSDTEFGVVTMGSGSCPAVAGELQILGDDSVRIEFGQSPRNPCTADLRATTHIYQLPSEVAVRPVTVTVWYDDFDTEYTLELG